MLLYSSISAIIARKTHHINKALIAENCQYPGKSTAIFTITASIRKKPCIVGTAFLRLRSAYFQGLSRILNFLDIYNHISAIIVVIIRLVIRTCIYLVNVKCKIVKG